MYLGLSCFIVDNFLYITDCMNLLEVVVSGVSVALIFGFVFFLLSVGGKYDADSPEMSGGGGGAGVGGRGE